MGSLHSRNVGSGELFPRIEEWKESEVPSGGSMQRQVGGSPKRKSLSLSCAFLYTRRDSI